MVAVFGANYSHALSLAGRHDEAVEEARRAHELDPSLGPAYQFLVLAYFGAGRRDEALAVARDYLKIPRSGDLGPRGSIAYVLGGAGDRARAEALLRELEALPAGTWRRSSSLLRAYLGLGDTARALDALERAAEAPVGELVPLNVSLGAPMYDAIRGSPRFAAVIRNWGLDERIYTSPTGGRPR